VLEADRGSFRDPDSRVFLGSDGVFRGLSERGLADWRALKATRFFADATDNGRVVGTIDEGSSVLDQLPNATDYAAALRHDRIPFVSYPYEWPFSMLKDAALLQLELLLAALDEGFVLKDASPYNVQWRGSRPVFIDIGSFEPLRPGEIWAGYRQFCALFLYPLLLQAYKDVPFQPWLRGSLEGIPPRAARACFSRLDLFKPGVFTHVHLHSRLEAKYERQGTAVRREVRAAGFNPELIAANVRRLRRLVSRLQWRPATSEWSAYAGGRTYSDDERLQKASFVRDIVGSRRHELVWDLGANDGLYTRIAAENARYTVAIDADPVVVDSLYRSLSAEGHPSILPLAVDLADPSPGLGWRGCERAPLETRGRPDLMLCLALIHHLALSRNVPVSALVDWLAAHRAHVVLEFPTRDDEMVRQLLERKPPGSHPDYDRATFERLLSDVFEIERSEPLAAGTRVLYSLRPRT
jgi:hypothetical protein